MNVAAIQDYLKLAPVLRDLPKAPFWMSYDAEVDVAYINFHNPARSADDSEQTDDDVIVRYDGDEVIGLTILHASQRSPSSND